MRIPKAGFYTLVVTLLIASRQVRADAYRPLDGSATAFVGVSVLPMDTDAVLPDQTVVVRDGLIAEIGPRATTNIARGIVQVDGTGMFLIPGLADMHVHVFDRSDFDLLLANGVTTITNMSGAPIHLEWKDQLIAGKMVGPALFTTGSMIESRSDPIFHVMRLVTTPDEARQLVRDTKECGYDFVKIHGDPEQAVYDAAVDEARKAELPVVGHGSEKFELEHCLKAKQATIEHAEEFVYCFFHRKLDESRIPEVVKLTMESGAFVTPTLVTYASIVGVLEDIDKMMRRPELRYYAKWKQENWGPAKNSHLKGLGKDRAAWCRQCLLFQKQLVKALNTAGVPLMTGSDYGGPAFLLPGFDVHAELGHLVDAGLSPYDALRCATVNPSHFLKQPAGKIRPGNRADLVLLRGNPLTDIANTSKIAGVMVRGKWLPDTELKRMLDTVVAQNAADDKFIGALLKSGSEGSTSTAPAGEPSVSEAALVWRVYQATAGGEMDIARKYAGLIAKYYPNSYVGFDIVGTLNLQGGNKDAAAEAFRQSLKLNPRNPVTQRRLKEGK